ERSATCQSWSHSRHDPIRSAAPTARLALASRDLLRAAARRANGGAKVFRGEAGRRARRADPLGSALGGWRDWCPPVRLVVDPGGHERFCPAADAAVRG